MALVTVTTARAPRAHRHPRPPGPAQLDVVRPGGRPLRRPRRGGRRQRLPGRGPDRRRPGLLLGTRARARRSPPGHRGPRAPPDGPAGHGVHGRHRARRCATMPQPVIAAIKGPAYGGGMCLSLGADIRLAGRSAVFCGAGITNGLTGCELGVSWLLPRAVGHLPLERDPPDRPEGRRRGGRAHRPGLPGHGRRRGARPGRGHGRPACAPSAPSA